MSNPPTHPIIVFGKSILSSKEGNSGAQKNGERRKGRDFVIYFKHHFYNFGHVTMAII